jgi:hypothetical protein
LKPERGSTARDGIDHTFSKDLRVTPEQTFLVADQGNMWNLLDRGTTYKKVENSSEFATIAKGAGKLQLQLLETGTGKILTVLLSLKSGK